MNKVAVTHPAPKFSPLPLLTPPAVCLNNHSLTLFDSWYQKATLDNGVIPLERHTPFFFMRNILIFMTFNMTMMKILHCLVTQRDRQQLF